jgi:hypothetical protein
MQWALLQRQSGNFFPAAEAESVGDVACECRSIVNIDHQVLPIHLRLASGAVIEVPLSRGWIEKSLHNNCAEPVL